MASRNVKIVATICRIILALTFILSGFTKAVDPWGVAIIISDYLAIYGLDSLQGASMVLSIGLCGLELMVGCMLLVGLGMRIVSIAAFVSMVFFTILTFLSATWLPVADCGCFGEAIKLTPWQTFTKNIILLPISFILLYRYRREKLFAFTRSATLCTTIIFILSMSIGISCYRHLPWIDFLPYKIGVNIHDQITKAEEESGTAVEVIMVYRNLVTGETKEFKLEDSEWQDEAKWEWIETKTDAKVDVIEALVSDFAVRSGDEDVTYEIVTTQGRLYMICAESADKISPQCEKRIGALIRRAYDSGDRVIYITPESLDGQIYKSFDGGNLIRCFNVDGSLLKTMLRASVGVIELVDGTIVDKKNCRDIDI